MTAPTIKDVAVIGTGVIGRSWIRVFARAGCSTRVFDNDPAQLDGALAWARKSAREDVELGFIDESAATAEAAVIQRCDSLEEALAGVGWAQESGPETIDIKRSIYAELDAAADASTILGSSTSAHDMSRIAAGLAGARRCIVAHPVNPPHVVPAVEVLPGSETDPEVLAATLAFLKSVGQVPIEMNHYLPGFLINRMQAALIREAIYLIGTGAASADAIDTAIRESIGLRWALMGPFGTAHTNADGGAGQYYRRYGDAYRSLWADLETDPDFSDEVIDRIHSGTEEIYGPDAMSDLRDWRDRLVRRIRKLKEEDGPPSP